MGTRLQDKAFGPAAPRGPSPGPISSHHRNDPAAVAVWSADLPADSDVLVYCVCGHEVGGATAMRLRAAGLNPCFLRGGIDGWAAAGRPPAERAAGEKP